MDRALSINPKSYEYIVELGYQHLMAGNVDQALKCFKMGVSVDQTSTTASVGVIHCLLKKNQLKSASQQLEFLTEVVKDKGPSAVSRGRGRLRRNYEECGEAQVPYSRKFLLDKILVIVVEIFARLNFLAFAKVYSIFIKRI